MNVNIDTKEIDDIQWVSDIPMGLPILPDLTSNGTANSMEKYNSNSRSKTVTSEFDYQDLQIIEFEETGTLQTSPALQTQDHKYSGNTHYTGNHKFPSSFGTDEAKMPGRPAYDEEKETMSREIRCLRNEIANIQLQVRESEHAKTKMIEELQSQINGLKSGRGNESSQGWYRKTPTHLNLPMLLPSNYQPPSVTVKEGINGGKYVQVEKCLLVKENSMLKNDLQRAKTKLREKAKEKETMEKELNHVIRDKEQIISILRQKVEKYERMISQQHKDSSTIDCSIIDKKSSDFSNDFVNSFMDKHAFSPNESNEMPYLKHLESLANRVKNIKSQANASNHHISNNSNQNHSHGPHNPPAAVGNTRMSSNFPSKNPVADHSIDQPLNLSPKTSYGNEHNMRAAHFEFSPAGQKSLALPRQQPVRAQIHTEETNNSDGLTEPVFHNVKLNNFFARSVTEQQRAPSNQPLHNSQHPTATTNIINQIYRRKLHQNYGASNIPLQQTRQVKSPTSMGNGPLVKYPQQQQIQPQARPLPTRPSSVSHKKRSEMDFLRDETAPTTNSVLGNKKLYIQSPNHKDAILSIIFSNQPSSKPKSPQTSPSNQVFQSRGTGPKSVAGSDHAPVRNSSLSSSHNYTTTGPSPKTRPMVTPTFVFTKKEHQPQLPKPRRQTPTGTSEGFYMGQEAFQNMNQSMLNASIGHTNNLSEVLRGSVTSNNNNTAANYNPKKDLIPIHQMVNKNYAMKALKRLSPKNTSFQGQFSSVPNQQRHQSFMIPSGTLLPSDDDPSLVVGPPLYTRKVTGSVGRGVQGHINHAQRVPSNPHRVSQPKKLIQIETDDSYCGPLHDF